MQQAKSEKEEHLRVRKISSSIAKEVKHFWDSMRKVTFMGFFFITWLLQCPLLVFFQIVEHKQQLILEAKRRKAMDLHLEFIVNQTAKYSDWLAQGLGSTPGNKEPAQLKGELNLRVIEVYI